MDIINVPNRNITWEIAKVLNYGLDAVLWKNLSMSVDYFYERRQGILIRRNESVPSYTGLALPQENLGEVDNSGIELMLDYKNR
jgi:outer membrane receptor protein involved in Fe transport